MRANTLEFDKTNKEKTQELKIHLFLHLGIPENPLNWTPPDVDPYRGTICLSLCEIL